MEAALKREQEPDLLAPAQEADRAERARDRVERAQEADLLERVAQYREDYRSRRAAALNEQREQHIANGEVYLDGLWLDARDADRVGRALQQREFLAFFELTLLLIVLVAAAAGLCWLFDFLFLPE